MYISSDSNMLCLMFNLRIYIICIWMNCVISSSQNEIIEIGFLGSYHPNFSTVKLIAGAVSEAVDAVNSNNDLLPHHKLTFVVGNTGEPNSVTGITKMEEMRDRVAVFIGPDHCCACEALTSAAWNIPMIAFQCSDPRVSNKKVYTTFARTLPPSSKVSKSVISLLLKYGWNIIVLVVTQDPPNLQAEETLIELAKKYNITIKKTHYMPSTYIRASHFSNLTDIIEDTYEITRVYVLLSDDYMYVDFVHHMNSRNLLAKGEYMVIYVEKDQILNRENKYQFLLTGTQTTNDSFTTMDFTFFKSALIIIPTYLMTSTEFENKVIRRSSQPPFSIPFLPFIRISVPFHASLLYDAIIIYAKAATEVLKQGKSIKDGKEILKYICSTTYTSVLEFNMTIDENCDAEGNYTLLALQPHNTTKYSFRPFGIFTYSEEELPILKLTRTINWMNGKQPAVQPKCGFNNEHCFGKNGLSLFLISCACILILIITIAIAFRHYRYEQKLACLLWKIESKDLSFAKPSTRKTVRESDEEGMVPSDEETLILNKDCSERTIAFYKGNTVFIKPIHKKCVDLTRSVRKEMIQIRELRHENINPFIGACSEPPNICIVSAFSSRGSLKDVLKNSDINLDKIFIASLISDLIKGMTFLHESEILSHGRLTSSNCLVDNRWVLRISDFGLHEFKEGRQLTFKEEKKYLKSLLWRAPELLRLTNVPARGTQKGDIYSFAIILHEVLGRQGPWGPRTLPYKNIIEQVTMGPAMNDGYSFRPPVTAEIISRWPQSILRCMQECWREDFIRRPHFRAINVKLREMFSERKASIFDNMLLIMEKYASNLEGLVQERTHLLMEEKKKTENLLLRMLPKTVAEQLKKGQKVEAESFDSVTIYFSDIVGFTELSAMSTPLQVVNLLNDLYTRFDNIIGGYDVYKVETIGDAYMVVSGLPIKNGDCHAAEIAAMALHLLEAINKFKIHHQPGETLKLRVGIHSGPCVAGVVGKKMPRFCLFGDTVNTASRMESTGEALKIHLSSSCKEILDKFGEFNIQERGIIQVKGKGEMRTYWLIGRSFKFSSLSDDAKLRRHTDSRLEVRFPPRAQQSNWSPSIMERECAWSTSQTTNSNANRSIKNCKWQSNVSFAGRCSERLKQNELNN